MYINEDREVKCDVNGKIVIFTLLPSTKGGNSLKSKHSYIQRYKEVNENQG